jgi:hypothetical protein
MARSIVISPLHLKLNLKPGLPHHGITTDRGNANVIQ